MIKIRKLQEKDIPFMIEWMSDIELTKYFKNDFAKYANVEGQQQFILNSFNDNNMNFAIVDSEIDEYLGSVSLKNINYGTKEAEYSIFIRRDYQEENVALRASLQILKYAFMNLELNRVYLCDKDANKFYNKFGFNFDETKEKLRDINWYSITKEDFFNIWKSYEKPMTNVRRTSFAPITDNRGDLIALENPRQLEFPLNRVYYMYNVGNDIVRGRHSHYDLQQLLIAVSGRVTVLTKTPFEEKEYILDKPNEGLYIGNMIWREMYDFSKDAVLMVLASHKYDESDYIRDYEVYKEEAVKYFKKR